MNQRDNFHIAGCERLQLEISTCPVWIGLLVLTAVATAAAAAAAAAVAAAVAVAGH